MWEIRGVTTWEDAGDEFVRVTLRDERGDIYRHITKKNVGKLNKAKVLDIAAELIGVKKNDINIPHHIELPD